ncbi:MAG: hypothetical protein R2795_13665 [Saprospiraceae bacterium]
MQIDNRSFFDKYLKIRLVIHVLLVLSIASSFWGFESNQYLRIISVLGFVLPLPLLIYEGVNKPALIDLKVVETGVLVLNLFIPETRYYYRYSRTKEVCHVFKPDVVFRYELEYIPFTGICKIRLIFSSQSLEGNAYATPFMDFTWAKKDEIIILGRIAKLSAMRRDNKE